LDGEIRAFDIDYAEQGGDLGEAVICRDGFKVTELLEP